MVAELGGRFSAEVNHDLRLMSMWTMNEWHGLYGLKFEVLLAWKEDTSLDSFPGWRGWLKGFLSCRTETVAAKLTRQTAYKGSGAWHPLTPSLDALRLRVC